MLNVGQGRINSADALTGGKDESKGGHGRTEMLMDPRAGASRLLYSNEVNKVHRKRRLVTVVC